MDLLTIYFLLPEVKKVVIQPVYANIFKSILHRHHLLKIGSKF